LKDRWELTSPRQVPGRFVEVILWGLQVELGRLSNRLRQTFRLKEKPGEETTDDEHVV
jgi:hypothetical protein